LRCISSRWKPGSLSQGSGTTPTLLDPDGPGGRDGYVAITDNADERMHVLVYRRDPALPAAGRLVCRVPVFGAGATEPVKVTLVPDVGLGVVVVSVTAGCGLGLTTMLVETVTTLPRLSVSVAVMTYEPAH